MHYAPNCSANPRHRAGDPRHEAECVDPNQGDLLALIDDETLDELPPAVKTMTEEFVEFHRENPHVYRALRDLARDWLAEGKTKCSITLLYNVCRWRLSLRTKGEGMFELNDHFQAFYSRALMHFEPDLAGMFNLRSAPEADAWIATYQNGQGAA